MQDTYSSFLGRIAGLSSLAFAMTFGTAYAEFQENQCTLNDGSTVAIAEYVTYLEDNGVLLSDAEGITARSFAGCLLDKTLKHEKKDSFITELTSVFDSVLSISLKDLEPLTLVRLAGSQHLQTLRLALKQGANPNTPYILPSATDFETRGEACFRSMPDSPAGRTIPPLKHAIFRLKAEAVKILLTAGAKIYPEGSRETAFDWALRIKDASEYPEIRDALKAQVVAERGYIWGSIINIFH